MAELVEERTGWRFDRTQLQNAPPPSMSRILDLYAEKLGLAGDRSGNPHYRTFTHNLDKMTPAEQLQDVYEKLIEPTLIDPCFVTHVPSVIIPLARKAKDDEFFADVYELAINGVEISPGYTELNDPAVQAANFLDQVGDKEEQQKTDDDFLTALKYGMPPAGGMGMGIDRLMMMLTGAESIRDVILFPLMRPVIEVKGELRSGPADVGGRIDNNQGP
jgi:aspartyl/asparaginyl-tRNA synthetase